jgi:hypothetical protein
MVNLLIISAKGGVRINKAAVLTAEGLAKALRKPALPTVIGTWLVEDGAVELTLWGWSEAYGTTTKSAVFVLPAPHKKLTLYGEAIVSATRNGKPADLTEEAWTAYSADIEETEDVPTPLPPGDDAVSEPDGEIDEFDEEDDINGDLEEADEVIEEVAEEEEEAEVEVEDEEDEAAEEEEEEDGEDDCYDSDDGGGGGKRRAPRRRAMAAPEFRRMEIGLRSRIKIPTPTGKRAPKWQTGAELEPE